MENYGNDKKLDTFLLFVMVSLIAIGITTLYVLQPHLRGDLSNIDFYIQQITWFVIGGIGIAAIMLLDFDFYRKLAWPLYFLGVAMLAGLFVFAVEINGSYSWYQLPVGSLQPSEFMKVFLVITLAHVITSHNEQWTYKNLKYDSILLSKILGLTIPPLVLIVMQPDLGSGMVILSIAGFLILISGIRWRFIFSLIGILAVFSGILVVVYLMFTEQFVNFWMDTPFRHAVYRIQAWQNPHLYEDGSGMQSIRSMLAIGSGELFGKGLGNFQLSIPEQHSDMIFTAIAEQFGFIGSSVVIILYFLLIYRIIQIALDCRDPFGTYLAVGFVGMFFYQIFQNIGMSVQLLPLTGLPLPFLSYGGTSLLVYMAAIGIVLNIHSRKKDYMFETE
ncbi:FtsW/RodA/SpoVE family cell cycle protein [Alkalibacillus almallahensis]|uniref:FtsW/RodA/SpoVE family cell cycle protein n=1 Tax=Alkalibacillus almallahensis TaxID=1379154 RepID=UPI001420C83E|nr:FtsW/RodA/SpoVE family cell cycle protein [Alkalibacillus almallahensis]NIK13222.1 cell division protein FtsW (lipid II flippase) [Alkalibacillus almallahensis]